MGFIAFLWCISPLVFIPLFIVYYNKYKNERSINDFYNETGKRISNETFFEENQEDYTPQSSDNSSSYRNNNETSNYTEKLFKDEPPSISPKHDDIILPINKSKPISTINIVLIIGVIFIILAGIVFATTTWQSIPNFFRTIIILSVTVFFFAVSSFSEKKLNLEKTGVAFFFLGSIFLPISVISIGFFELFGVWFSLSGDGRYVLLMIAAFSLGAAAFVGTQKYNMISLACTFYFCISAFAICLFSSFHLDNNTLGLLLAVFSMIILIAASRISSIESYKYDLLLSCIKRYVILNTIVLSAISMIISDSTAVSSLSTVIFALLFLKKAFNSNEESHGVYPFAFLLIFGFYKLIVPENISDYMMVATASAVAFAVVGQMGKLNAKMKKLLNVISIITVALSVVCLGFPSLISNKWTGTELITLCVMLINITWLALKFKNKVALYFQPLVLIILICGTVSYFTDFALRVNTLISILSLAAFVLYKEFKVLRTNASDIIFAATPFICFVSSLFISFDLRVPERLLSNYPFYMLASSVIFMLITCLIAFEKDESRSAMSKLFSFIVPFAFATIVFAAAEIANDYSQLYFFIYFAIIILSAALTSVFEGKSKIAERLKGSLALYTIVLIVISFIVIESEFRQEYVLPYLWLAALYFGVKSYCFYRDNQFEGKQNFFVYLALGMLIGASVVTTGNSAKDYLLCYLMPTLFTLALFAGHMIYSKVLKKENWFFDEFNKFFSIISALESVLLIIVIHNHDDLSAIYFAACIIAAAVSYYSFLLLDNNLFAFIPTLIIYPFIRYSIIRSGIDQASSNITIISILIFVLIAFTAKIIRKNVFNLKDNNTIIDWLSILNFFVLFNIDAGKYTSFIRMSIAVIYSLTFYNRFAKKTINPYILTLSGTLAVFSFWIQPFFTIKSVLETEVNLIPVVAFCALFSRIWKDNKKLVDFVCFAISVISVAVLSLEAMERERLADALILVVISLIMVIASFIKKRKKWFFFSVLTLVFLTIYLSRSFWLSLEWWIYLLSAGIILIALASLNEVQKQRGDSLKEKTSRFLTDWEW